jgi:hypothetical protein
MEVFGRRSLNFECGQLRSSQAEGVGKMGNVLENKMTLGESLPWGWGVGAPRELFEKEVV